MALKIKGELQVQEGLGLPLSTTPDRLSYTPPQEGYKVWDTDLQKEFNWNGSAWESAGGADPIFTFQTLADVGDGNTFVIDANLGNYIKIPLTAATTGQTRTIGVPSNISEGTFIAIEIVGAANEVDTIFPSSYQSSIGYNIGTVEQNDVVTTLRYFLVNSEGRLISTAGDNFYNSNGTINSNRIVTLAGNNLTLLGTGSTFLRDSGVVGAKGYELTPENVTPVTGTNVLLAASVSQQYQIDISNTSTGDINIDKFTNNFSYNEVSVVLNNTDSIVRNVIFEPFFYKGFDGTVDLGTVVIPAGEARVFTFQHKGGASFVLIADSNGIDITGFPQQGIVVPSIIKQGIYQAEGTNGATTLYAATGSLDRVMVSSIIAGVGTVISVPVGESLNGILNGTYTTQSSGELVLFLDNGIGLWTAQVVGASTSNSLQYIRVYGPSTSGPSTTVGINFATTEAGNIPYVVATGRFTLTAGKTYHLTSEIGMNSVSSTSIVQWYDVTAAAFIGTQGRMANASSQANTQAESIFKPLVDTEVELRRSTTGGGTLTVAESSAAIKQIITTEVALAGMVTPILLERGFATLASDYDLSGGNSTTFEDVGLSVTLPVAGTYQLTGVIAGENSGGDDRKISAIITDSVNTQVGTTANVAGHADFGGAENVNSVGTATIVVTVTTTGANEVYKVRGSQSSDVNPSLIKSTSRLEYTQLPNSTVVNPDSLTPESLDSIQVELSGDLATVADGSSNRTVFDSVTNAGAGTFSLNADGTVTLTAGGRYKINAYAYTASSANGVIYDFTNDVVLSGYTAGSSAVNQAGSLVTIVSPVTDINVGLGFSTAETVQGDATNNGRASMLVESISGSSITYVDPNLVVPETPAYGRMRYETDPGNEQITSMQPADYDTTDYTNLITATPASGTFTITQAGRYELSYMQGYTAADTGFINAVAVIDGGAIDMANTIAAAGITGTTGSSLNISGTLELDLAIGQTVEVHIVDSTGTALTVDTIGAGSNSRTFSIRQQPASSITYLNPAYTEAEELHSFSFSNTGTASIPTSGSPSKVDFSAAGWNTFDPNGLVDLTNDVIKIQQAGNYQCHVGSLAISANSKNLEIRLNGTTVAAHYPNVGAETGQSVNVIIACAVGDEIEFGYLTSGGTHYGFSCTVTQLPTHTVTTLVDPTLVTPETLSRTTVSGISNTGITDGVALLYTNIQGVAGIPYDNTTGFFSLTGGKTYRLSGRLRKVDGNPKMGWCGSVGSTALVTGTDIPSNADAFQSETVTIVYTPTVDEDVKFCPVGVGTLNIQGSSGYAIVEQIPGYSVTTPGTVAVDDQAASGYVDMGTMRMQWGIVTSTTTTTPVVYPAAFNASGVISVTADTEAVDNILNIDAGGSTTSVGITSKWHDGGPGTAGANIHWKAFGLKP